MSELKPNGKIVFDSNVFEAGMTVPESTNANTAAGLRTGGQEGRLAVVFRVAADSVDLVLPITETIILSWLDSATDASYTAPAATDGVPIYTITATAEKTWEAGDIVARLLIPMQLGLWVKPNIAVSSALAGLPTMDVFLEYLAN